LRQDEAERGGLQPKKISGTSKSVFEQLLGQLVIDPRIPDQTVAATPSRNSCVASMIWHSQPSSTEVSGIQLGIEQQPHRNF
jgi:hypothetical protein